MENLKDIWKNQGESKISFSETDIYKMMHKKSASIVKWIFYISIIEFLIFIIPAFFIETSQEEKELGLTLFTRGLSILNYVLIMPVFIYLFYKNYKSICTQDSSKKLMNDILKTKKTVTYYVYTQLTLIAVLLSVFFYKFSHSDLIPENSNKAMIIGLSILIILFFLVIVWLFYKLLYGILLKELNSNYKELQKNEKA